MTVMSDALCPDCGRLAYACDCPTYDAYVDDPYQEDVMTDDPINPNHYRGKQWECIEIIEAHGLDHFRATALAYLLRAARKNGVEDLRKALWYLQRLAGSPMNLANANGFVTTDPARAVEMTGIAVADDFGIVDIVDKPTHELHVRSYLHSAIKSLIPDPQEFLPAASLLEDLNDAIAAIECEIEALQAASQP